MFENMEKEVHALTLCAILGMVMTIGAMEYVSTKNPTLPSVSKYTGERVRYAKVVADEEITAMADRTGTTPAYHWVKDQIAE